MGALTDVLLIQHCCASAPTIRATPKWMISQIKLPPNSAISELGVYVNLEYGCGFPCCWIPWCYTPWEMRQEWDKLQNHNNWWRRRRRILEWSQWGTNGNYIYAHHFIKFMIFIQFLSIWTIWNSSKLLPSVSGLASVLVIEGIGRCIYVSTFYIFKYSSFYILHKCSTNAPLQEAFCQIGWYLHCQRQQPQTKGWGWLIIIIGMRSRTTCWMVALAMLNTSLGRSLECTV